MDQATIRGAESESWLYGRFARRFAGRLGKNQAPAGTLVSPATTVLNNLVQLDPRYVSFNPSETDLVEIEKACSAGKVEAEILVAGDTRQLPRGELTFIDNNVDRATGTVGD